jgi:hypothetical protein
MYYVNIMMKKIINPKILSFIDFFFLHFVFFDLSLCFVSDAINHLDLIKNGGFRCVRGELEPEASPLAPPPAGV